MRERPILFNTEMVMALLNGTKTCTRRVVRYKYSNTEMKIKKDKYGARLIEIQKDENSDGSTYQKLLPFVEKEAPYQPGDILYVRETWQEVYDTEWDSDKTQEVKIQDIICNFDDISKKCVGLSTEYSTLEMKPRNKYYIYKTDDIKYTEPKWVLKWRPSIHMPKEAARIFLKVTDVRVERLQEITVDDCHRECINIATSSVTDRETLKRNHDFSLEKFETLWDSTIKKSDLDRYGWDANPYVWVIEFERCEKPPECIFKGYDKAPDDGSEKCLGYMYDNRDELLPMCEKCSYQASYENEEEK